MDNQNERKSRILSDANFSELGSIKRTSTKEQQGLEMIKNSHIPRKMRERRIYYLVLSIASMIVLLLLIPFSQQMNSSTKESSVIEIVQQNKVSTTSFKREESEEEFGVIVNDFLSESTETVYSVEDHSNPVNYQLKLEDGSSKLFEVWFELSMGENKVHGFYSPVGEESFYELTPETTKQLMKRFQKYDTSEEEKNLEGYKRVVKNEWLESPDFMDKVSNGMIGDVPIPLGISAQQMITNILGYPSHKEASSGGYILYYDDYGVGFEVGFDYDRDPFIPVYSIHFAIDLEEDHISALLGEPDLAAPSETITKFNLFYYFGDKTLILYRVDDDTRYIGAILITNSQ